MKTVVTICGTCIAALAFAGLAAAATPQGRLTGFAKFNGNIFITPFAGQSIHKITITSTISDGETVYVNRNNDPSGDCDGDVGTIEIQYNSSAGGEGIYNIDCAHFSGGNQMMVSYTDTMIGAVCGCDAHVVFRVQGRPLGTDDVLSYGTETSATRALQWVNLGTEGSGHEPLTREEHKFGDFFVTA